MRRWSRSPNGEEFPDPGGGPTGADGSRRRAYVTGMRTHLTLAAGLALAVMTAPAPAQLVPTPPVLENRIPAPLPPPAPPPIINGPLGQGPAPRLHKQPRIDSPGERAARCFHEGAGYGLRGGALGRYSRTCANN